MSDASQNDDSQQGHLTVPCPRCGRPLGPFVTVCPECGTSIGTTPNDLPKSRHRYSITLGDVMFIIGSVAIVFAVAIVWLEAAAVLSLVVLIALVRTLWGRHQARVRNITLSFGDVVTLVTASLAIAVVIAISAGIAFCATCLPTGALTFGLFYNQASIVFFVPIMIGIAAAVFVGWKIGKRCWMSGMPARLEGIQYLAEPPAGPPPIDALDVLEETLPPNASELPQ